MAVSQHIWHCGAGLPGDVLITDLRAYRYGPHFHDAWSIGAIDYGACAFTVRDAPHLAQAGDLVVIAPGDVHTGGTSETPLGYRMLYVEPSWLDDHARALLGAAAAFDGPVIRDPALCAQWLAALAPEGMDERAAPSASRPRCSRCCASTRAAGPMASEDEDVCDQLRARMARDPACAPDLEALARAQARHRTTLVKQFARRYGLPPQAWLRNWRVARARTAARRPAAGRRRACRGLRRPGAHDAGVQAGLRQHAGRVPQGIGRRPVALKD